MSDAAFLLRRATPSDARSLAALAEATFRDTFASFNTAEDMDLHCRRTYGEAIQAAEIDRNDMITLVAEEAGRLLGYAQMRWGEAPGCVATRIPGEIRRLYVRKEAIGTGLAHALMRACLDEMARRGFDSAWLGVWENNPRAIAFYRKFGFAPVGEHVFPVGNDPQRDVIMACKF
ncbi:MAG: GNAT family N-acetyltransferase [Burkholderiales bacterium]